MMMLTMVAALRKNHGLMKLMVDGLLIQVKSLDTHGRWLTVFLFVTAVSRRILMNE